MHNTWGERGGQVMFAPAFLWCLYCVIDPLSPALLWGEGGQGVVVHAFLRCLYGVMEILWCYGDSGQPSGATYSAQSRGKEGGSDGVRSFTPMVIPLCYGSSLPCNLMRGRGGQVVFVHALS